MFPEYKVIADSLKNNNYDIGHIIPIVNINVVLYGWENDNNSEYIFDCCGNSFDTEKSTYNITKIYLPFLPLLWIMWKLTVLQHHDRVSLSQTTFHLDLRSHLPLIFVVIFCFSGLSSPRPALSSDPPYCPCCWTSGSVAVLVLLSNTVLIHLSLAISSFPGSRLCIKRIPYPPPFRSVDSHAATSVDPEWIYRYQSGTVTTDAVQHVSVFVVHFYCPSFHSWFVSLLFPSVLVCFSALLFSSCFLACFMCVQYRVAYRVHSCCAWNFHDLDYIRDCSSEFRYVGNDK